MSIKLINSNYEFILESFTDHIYIKITNLINYLSYDKYIYSYDINYEWNSSALHCLVKDLSGRIKTLKNLWNIIVKAFEIVDKYNVNILEPDLTIFENDYIVFKLLEQQNDIVLTVYYNMIINFEFFITLNKVTSDDLIYDLSVIQNDIQYKDKQIFQLQNEVIRMFNICSNIDSYVGLIYDTNSMIEPIFCQLMASTINISVIPGRWIDIKTNFSKFINLNKLSLCNYNYGLNIEIVNDTLEVLEISNGFYYDQYSFIIPNIFNIPKLKHLEFLNCIENFNYANNNLLEQLNDHPNKQNIEIVFRNSSYFKNNIEEYKSIGLKDVIVC